MRSATTRSQNSSRRLLAPRSAFRVPRSAFTLIELMITISILLLLTIITARVVNSTLNNDRVPGGARQVQSYLEGSRDRAIYSTKTLNPGPRGVRFLRGPNDLKSEDINGNGTLDPGEDINNNGLLDTGTFTVTSMVYIGPPRKYEEGLLEIGETDSVGNVTSKRKIRIRNINPGGNNTYDPSDTLWSNLELRKLILSGARIEIPPRSEIFYTIINRNPNGYPGDWELTKDYPASKFPRVEPKYSLELEPAVLPNQEPRLFPRNVVIDIKHSWVPASWTENRMDILFSPRGMVVGRAAVGGYIHLVLTDLADAEHDRVPGQRDFLDAQDNVIPGKEGDERIVTINTRTGSVTVHSVDPTDLFDNQDNSIITPDGFPDDPFRFAETGEEL